MYSVRKRFKFIFLQVGIHCPRTIYAKKYFFESDVTCRQHIVRSWILIQLDNLCLKFLASTSDLCSLFSFPPSHCLCSYLHCLPDGFLASWCRFSATVFKSILYTDYLIDLLVWLLWTFEFANPGLKCNVGTLVILPIHYFLIIINNKLYHIIINTGYLMSVY